MAERVLHKLPKRIIEKMPADYLANEKEYWRLRNQLLASYRGKWIAVAGGRVIASGETFVEVMDKAGQTGHASAYIDRMGAEGEMQIRCRRVEFPYNTDYTPTALPQAVVTFTNFDETRKETFSDVIPDTGSDLSALREDDADHLALLSGPQFPASVTGAGDQSSPCVVCRGHAYINGRDYNALIQVIPDQTERFLGREVMNRTVVTFDGPGSKVIFQV